MKAESIQDFLKNNFNIASLSDIELFNLANQFAYFQSTIFAEINKRRIFYSAWQSVGTREVVKK